MWSWKIAVVAVVAVALVAGGAAAGLAQSRGEAASADRDAFVADVAARLDVSEERLREALKGASLAQIQRLLERGAITEEQAERKRDAIESGRLVPPLGHMHRGRGGPGGMRHGLFGGLDAAATYLGLTEAQLRERLRAGRSLAQIARAEGKTVEGLKRALTARLEARLDEAVAAGRLDQARKAELLERMRERLDAMVERTGPWGRKGRKGNGNGNGPPGSSSSSPLGLPPVAA